MLVIEFLKTLGGVGGWLSMRRVVRLGKERAISKVELVEGRV